MNNAQENATHPPGVLDELRVAHLNLMERSNARERGKDADLTKDIESFTTQLQASGARLSDMLDRKEAQGVLDYWSSHLVSNGGVDLKTWTQPRIAAFDKSQASHASTADIEKTRAELARIDENNRQIIRISALARQWRLAGKSDGYLLGGDALANAKKFQGQDKDIDQLITASEAFVADKNRKWRKGAVALIALLLALVAVLGFLALRLWDASTKLETVNFDLRKEKFRLEVKKIELEAKAEKLARSNEELQKLVVQNSQLGNDLGKFGEAGPKTRLPIEFSTGGGSGGGSGDDSIVAMGRTIELSKGVFVEEAQEEVGGAAPPREVDAMPTPATFDTGSAEERMTMALEYNRRLRGRGNTTADQISLARSLVAMTNIQGFSALSAEGRHFLLFVLSLVPAQNWDKAEWSVIRTDLGNNLAVLEAAKFEVEPKSKQYLDALRLYVGLTK